MLSEDISILRGLAKWMDPVYQERQLRILNALEEAEKAIRHSIARADDYGDSGISQPIRKLLAKWEGKDG